MEASQAYGTEVGYDALLNLRHLVRHLPERRLAPTGRPGGFVSKKRGRGLETIDIRVFSDGDDFRHIDRNTTARTGITHVRTFHDEREKMALLIADFRPLMLWGTRRALRSVAAAEVLALAGWRVIQGGGRVGLIAIGGGEPVVIAARGRERGMQSVVGGLVKAHASAIEAVSEGSDTSDGLDRALEMAATVAPTGSTVFLATGLDNPGRYFEDHALALRRKAQLITFLVKDRFEADPPEGTYPLLGQSGRVLWAFVGKARAPMPEPRVRQLERVGAGVVPIDASSDPEQMAVVLDRYNIANG